MCVVVLCVAGVVERKRNLRKAESIEVVDRAIETRKVVNLS